MKYIVVIVVLLATAFAAANTVIANEVRCFSPTPDTTVCRNNKGETVKTIIEGKDGTFTVTTKEGTKRCFTMNGTVICR